jgi:hypothetical protein
MAAVVALLLLRPLRWRVVSISLACLLLAGREADLHKAFTHDSVTKINYFLNAGYPLGERILAGLALLAIAALVVDMAIAVIRFAIDDELFSYSWACVGAVVMGLLAGLKVLDRSEAWLYEKFAIDLSPVVGQTIGTIEEGLECALPLIVIFAISLVRDPRPAAASQPSQPAEGLSSTA